MSFWARRKSTIAFSLAILLGCARTPYELENKPQVADHSVSPSDEREAEVGRQIHQTILSSFRVYTEPRLAGYVTRTGRSIVRQAERQDQPYRFTVLYDDRCYANMAPGGFVYVTTGFLNFLQNEAELAALLAHEIAELQYRDPRFSLSRRAVGVLAQTGAVAAPFLGPMGVLAAMALILLDGLTGSLAPSQEAKVLKADKKALRYLLESGHDPQGYLDLLHHLLNVRRDSAPYFYDYFSSRPVTPKRYQAALAEFEKLPLEGKRFEVHRDRYLEMTQGVREIYR